MTFRQDGLVAEWGVRFSGAPKGQWLIQRISNARPIVSHCDGTEYPGASKLHDPPTPRYYEAWWVDAAGDVKVPKTLETPPKPAEPSGYGHDLWKFNTGSSKETNGLLSRRGTLYQAANLPPEFAFNAVPEAGQLPATTATPTGLGASVGDERSADVEWNYTTADKAIPWQEIRTTQP